MMDIERLKDVIDANIKKAIEATINEEVGTRAFSETATAFDYLAIDALREEYETRMFDYSEESKDFEKNMSLFNKLNSRYELYRRDSDDPSKRAKEEDRNCNFYKIKRGSLEIGYYGFQGGLDKVLQKRGFLSGDKTLKSLAGFNAHPDYFILIGKDLYIYECKFLMPGARLSQFLRQAGVCYSFEWLYNGLASKLSLDIHYTAILSDSFSGTKAEQFLCDCDVDYVISRLPELPI